MGGGGGGLVKLKLKLNSAKAEAKASIWAWLSLAIFQIGFVLNPRHILAQICLTEKQVLLIHYQSIINWKTGCCFDKCLGRHVKYISVNVNK